MKVKRGDVALAMFPHAIGAPGNKRPVVIVQSDAYNQTLQNMVVAEITSNLGRVADPAHLLLDLSTPEGQATGLLRDSLVSCINLATVNESRIDRVIGSLSDTMMAKLDDCLQNALGLP